MKHLTKIRHQEDTFARGARGQLDCSLYHKQQRAPFSYSPRPGERQIWRGVVKTHVAWQSALMTILMGKYFNFRRHTFVCVWGVVVVEGIRKDGRKNDFFPPIGGKWGRR